MYKFSLLALTLLVTACGEVSFEEVQRDSQESSERSGRREIEEALCDEMSCAEHAVCVADAETFTAECLCDPGFEGDGFFCDPMMGAGVAL